MNVATEQMNNSDITVSELFELWIAEKRKTISSETCRLYSKGYETYLKDLVGDRKVNDLTSSEWQETENKLPDIKNRYGNKSSVSAVRTVIRNAHLFFAYGSSKFGLNDPTGDNILPKDYYTSETVFSEQEVEKLRNAMKPYDLYHICVMLGIYTGIQQGELCGAKWGDVDTDEQILHIRRSLVREPIAKGTRKTELRLTELRNKNTVRDVPIPDLLNEQLKQLKLMHTDDDFLIVGKHGGVEPNSFVNHYYARFLASADVRFRPFSCTRNTFAKNCIKSGVSIEELSSVLGEPNIEYTKRKYYSNDK